MRARLEHTDSQTVELTMSWATECIITGGGSCKLKVDIFQFDKLEKTGHKAEWIGLGLLSVDVRR